MEGGLGSRTAVTVGLSLPGSEGRGSGGSHDMISVPEAAGGLSTDQPGRPAHSGGKVGRGSGGIHPVAIVASVVAVDRLNGDRKSTRLNSSHQIISYAVFCLKKKK